MSRTEVFHGTGPTSGSQIKVKMGVTNAGKITAVEAHLVYEAGAFPGSPVPSGCRTMFAYSELEAAGETCRPASRATSPTASSSE